MSHVVTVIGKPDCHLCDDARAQVMAVCAELGIEWQERSILDDPGLYDEYWEKIPVILIDGRVHDYWRVDQQRLRGALSDNRSRSSD
ncbi:MAG: glutaredoxin family protein [Actinobacteria bacterium]|uniref:Unannotated protein n=1 Tax=freshwater metagenome TaxID=449393 RepID=A0A6J7IQY7_9ZZZZ|nr:glutaredoxin family protein [Actinomycetota bacterium]